jgi:DNA replication initiation complex subunit (GINS family)
MSLCDRLFAAKKDEEGGVTEYGNLKSDITPENQDYIDSVENIISDEKNHLNKVTEMIKYFGCLEEEGKIKRRKRK